MHEYHEEFEKLDNVDIDALLPDSSDTRISNEFKPKQRLAIELFGRGGMTNREVARIVGVSMKTIEKWRSNPNFKNEIALYEGRKADERKGIIFEKMDEMELDAVKVLEELLKSDKESIKLKAALAVLDAKKKMSVDDNGAVNIRFLGMPTPAMPDRETHRGEV